MMEQTEKRNNPMKYVCLTVLPLLVSLVLQVVCAVIFSMVFSLIKTASLTASGITDQAVIQQEISGLIMENVAWSVFFYQLVALLVFAFWYAKSGEKKRLQNPRAVISGKMAAGILVLGIGLEFFTSAGLNSVGYFLPEVVKHFEELMQNAGMGEASLAAIIASVILAPIGEELLCRGLIFYYAKKISGRFIVANSIQALLFGVMHANLVQGVYAFILGYILGMLYEKFHSLYVPVFVHFVVNLSAYALVPLLLDPLPKTLPVSLLVTALSAAVAVAGWKIAGEPVLPDNDFKNKQEMV